MHQGASTVLLEHLHLCLGMCQESLHPLRMHGQVKSHCASSEGRIGVKHLEIIIGTKARGCHHSDIGIGVQHLEIIIGSKASARDVIILTYPCWHALIEFVTHCHSNRFKTLISKSHEKVHRPSVSSQPCMHLCIHGLHAGPCRPRWIDFLQICAMKWLECNCFQDICSM